MRQRLEAPCMIPEPTQTLEHDAEKCARFSDDIMLYFFDLDQDSDFRPIGPKIILI
ncbi:hypothetical protein HF263_10015 [Rhizobium leguminosarum]|uniref:hypothetical protein n=1 Tax=Rhizobium leguminosarum TaxID=384 RepID=UPI0014942E79|nr:hypothetical protein [Rhizobium leguminosarum]MBY2965525.1 hypothetical protein [Rhizobium leguminosarum]MBY2990887.1 hypothetical protein [Rhizobium leguminosarum]MBY3029987.1 hypothetical protein [Rhizobium leguminosarum]MBY3056393.1 hypothetical protein [Rhizobium leguminosarum]